MGIAIKSRSPIGKPRWEGPVVPYTIDPRTAEALVRRIVHAIYAVEYSTNVRFVRRTSEEAFVEFRHGQMCESDVGCIGTKQYITVSPGCSEPEIIHEIGHCLGLKHEHQRPDRDTFVTVLSENIIPSKAHNFSKLSTRDTIQSNEYDTQSIMHYKTDAFSANGRPTLVAVDPTMTLDESYTFTSVDKSFLEQLYKSKGIVVRSDSGDSGAGRIEAVTFARDDLTTLIPTAVITESGNLLLIAWQIGDTGEVNRLADSGNQAGLVSSVALASGNHWVTAVRSASNNLLLISWSVTRDAITRRADSGNLAGEADLIRILRINAFLFLTACRSASGTLLLITWRLDFNGAFTRLDTAEAGEFTEISLIRLRSTATGRLVVSTVRSAAGTVLSIVWHVSATGGIERRGDSGNKMGMATNISTCRGPAGHLVVGCRDARGNLLIITLLVSLDGTGVERVGDSGNQAGRISEVSALARPYGMLTAVRSGSGNLLLIAWSIDDSGAITRMGSSGPEQVGEATKIACGPSTNILRAPVVVGLKTASGTLKLITWDDQPEHGELT